MAMANMGALLFGLLALVALLAAFVMAFKPDIHDLRFARALAIGGVVFAALASVFLCASVRTAWVSYSSAGFSGFVLASFAHGTITWFHHKIAEIRPE
jgi:hypothetical protein